MNKKEATLLLNDTLKKLSEYNPVKGLKYTRKKFHFFLEIEFIDNRRGIAFLIDGDTNYNFTVFKRGNVWLAKTKK